MCGNNFIVFNTMIKKTICFKHSVCRLHAICPYPHIICWAKYALFTRWISIDEWILVDKSKAKIMSKYSIVWSQDTKMRIIDNWEAKRCSLYLKKPRKLLCRETLVSRISDAFHSYRTMCCNSLRYCKISTKKGRTRE